MRKKAALTAFTVLCFLALFTIQQPALAQPTTSVVSGVDFTETFTLISTADSDMVCELQEECTWSLEISVTNLYSHNMTDVTVEERLGAELEIDSEVYVEPNTFVNWTKGSTEKVFMLWTIGNMSSGDTTRLALNISTDINPGGVHEYSTCGDYFLNSGAVLKYHIGSIQMSEELQPVYFGIPCSKIPTFSDALLILPISIFAGVLVVRQRRK